jgi:hypothetical protein
LYIPAARAFNLNHRVPQIGKEKQAPAFFATYFSHSVIAFFAFIDHRIVTP